MMLKRKHNQNNGYQQEKVVQFDQKQIGQEQDHGNRLGDVPDILHLTFSNQRTVTSIY